MSEWISVEDRLPDVDEQVIVFAEGKIDGFIGDTVMAVSRRYYPLRSCNAESTYIDWVAPWAYFLVDYKITHWMPLPQPPKGVE